MKALLQRVAEAAVEVEGEGRRGIRRGLVVFVGIQRGDRPEEADSLARKVVKYRLFEDEAEKMNLSVQDVKGDLLVVSQFTLCADTRKGCRPSFDSAAPPAEAEPLYQRFVEVLRASGLRIETGTFGGSMRVQLLNEGPATFLLEVP